MSSEPSIPVSEARAQLSDLVNRVAYTGEQITLTRHGRPVAVLVSVAEAERARSELDDPTPKTVSTPEAPARTHHPEATPDADYRIAAQTESPPLTGGGRPGANRY